MSEIKLNLIDSQRILCGTIHGSVADRAVASLAAEPETIDELELALTRYERGDPRAPCFAFFHEPDCIDEEPWDAGLMIIDLSARLVATMSSYSYPHREGEVICHDGEAAGVVTIPYRLSDEWRFVDSVEAYFACRKQLVDARAANPPLEAREILYGQPLLDFIATRVLSSTDNSSQTVEKSEGGNGSFQVGTCVSPTRADSNKWPSQIHASWLSTPRSDLNNQSPRLIILEKQDLIDFDMHMRELQWSLQHEGPPCLPPDSNAYRFAGFGTHEWVIYYDLVRYLIDCAITLVYPIGDASQPPAVTSGALVGQLGELMTTWLETPNEEYGGRTPANLIESERKRLPIALSAREMIVSDDCPICQMMAADMELTNDVGFSHLDGAQMEDDFVFSSFLTREEWEADRLRWKEFNEDFCREKKESIARAAAKTSG